MPNTTIENPEEEPDQSGAIIPAADRQLQPNSGNNIRASWNFSTSDVRVNMHHATADRKKVLIDCFLWAIDEKHPSSLNEFAEAVDYDITVVRRLYQGKYTDQKGTRYDIPERLAENAKQWLARQRKKFQGKDEFVLTPTAKRIWTTLELARESKTVAFITGPSHIGKTWALENYSARNNHGASPFIRMKAASGLGGMIRRISETLGNASKGNTADLTDRIKKAVSPDMLLIFDELHLLMYTYRIGSFFACLEVIREIHDETGCGVALCGTQLLLEKMQGGKHTEMEQLLRRGVHKLQLPSMPTKGDLSAILERHGLDFPDRKLSVTVKGFVEKPYELLRQLAKVEGLLSIAERIRYAHKLAEKHKQEIAWDHFVAADLHIKSNAQPESDWN